MLIESVKKALRHKKFKSQVKRIKEQNQVFSLEIRELNVLEVTIDNGFSFEIRRRLLNTSRIQYVVFKTKVFVNYAKNIILTELTMCLNIALKITCGKSSRSNHIVCQYFGRLRKTFNQIASQERHF